MIRTVRFYNLRRSKSEMKIIRDINMSTNSPHNQYRITYMYFDGNLVIGNQECDNKHEI